MYSIRCVFVIKMHLLRLGSSKIHERAISFSQCLCVCVRSRNPNHMSIRLVPTTCCTVHVVSLIVAYHSCPLNGGSSVSSCGQKLAVHFCPRSVCVCVCVCVRSRNPNTTCIYVHTCTVACIDHRCSVSLSVGYWLKKQHEHCTFMLAW